MLQGREAYDLQDYGQTLQHIEAALPIARERLVSVRQDCRARLTAWRAQGERGVSCGEACLRMLLTAGQAKTVAVLPAMSQPR